MHQLVKKVFLPSWWRESKLSTIRNGRFAALAELACGPPLLIGLTSRCFAHWARASCAPATATSTIRNGRLAAPDGLQYFLAHWAYFALLRPLGARFVRPRHCHPLQFPLKSYGFPGAETARKRFLLWKMGFSDAKIAPPPPYTPPGTIEVRKGFALLCFFDSLGR